MTPSPMKLVVGLGNPGREYAGTRHNIGFDVVDEVATRLGWLAKPADFERLAKAKFEGLLYDGILGDNKLILLKPMTYMNVSGRSVLAAMQFYQLAPADVLVVLDDLALAVGQIRLRGDGSSGGHNGLKDIERMLGTQAYPRLRIGIDPKPPRIPQADYVLGKFTDDQRKVLEKTLPKAAGCIVTWADKGLVPAMNQFNVKEAGKDQSSPGVPGKTTQR